MSRDFPFQKQLNIKDCGPACLQMIFKYYGKSIGIGKLREASQFHMDGVSLLGISDAAEKFGFRTKGIKASFEDVINHIPLPAVLHWRQYHFVVLTPASSVKRLVIADPAVGVISLSKTEFVERWLSIQENDKQLGVVLVLEPTPSFYQQPNEKDKKIGWNVLYSYLWGYKKYLLQIFISLIVGSLLQLILPFLTQSIIDTGINTNNLQFIYIVLAAQLMLLVGRTFVDFVRSRLLLFISTHINIAILSDFWIKLLKLPLSYFDSKQTGDILQRLGDHHRIQQFLTGSTLSISFSFINIIMFSIVLLNYNWMVFFIFALGSFCYLFWIRIFLKYRRKLDYKRFDAASKENSATMQLIYGIQEIKLNNASKQFRWQWEGYQAILFKLGFKGLTLSQTQQTGALFFNEGKNILITFFVAKAVLDGQLTLGAMLAIQYIIGQLNGPIEQLIGFTQQAQDAKISLERLNEIHQMEDEEPIDKQLIHYLPENKSIVFSNVSFTYTGAGNDQVLKNLNLIIPEGKVTAIVGVSGSGKTTLLKLLLRFYETYRGEIRIGVNQNKQNTENHEKIASGLKLQNISPTFWHSQCASVMQEGYIFSETIAKNIAIVDDYPDYSKLVNACQIANILDFIESMPLGFNTKIGAEGNGISTGQKQRILIARAVYKNPHYLFLDEATNALDANNEKDIIENLHDFFKGRTVVIVAHRLSTVKNADNIVVLQDGIIVEEGTHNQLSSNKQYYYRLVKNQLELGS